MPIISQLLELVFPIAAIAAIFMVFSARRRLRSVESQLRQIEQRFIELRKSEFNSPLPAQFSPAEPIAETQPVVKPQAESGTSESAGPPPEETAENDTKPEPKPPEGSRRSSPATERASDTAGFEEQFGTRWVVWAGGIALALGGIFLVQFSIEQGLLGPGVRVSLGALLAAALIAAGEWLRRNERQSEFIGLPAAHIPSILTAAGTTVAYATVFAAYALYGFLNAAIAFVLLGAVALATLAAALLHGPALAALGLLGAFAAPLLIASDQPNYWALTIYLAVVTAAAFAMARARLWMWLVAMTAGFGFLWMIPGITDTGNAAIAAHAAHAVIGFALAAVFVVSGFLFGPDRRSGYIDVLSSAVLAVYLVAAGLLVLAQNHDPIAFAAFALIVAGTVWIALQAEAAAAAVPAAALLVAVVMLAWTLEIAFVGGVFPDGPSYFSPVEPRLAANQFHIFVGAGFALLFGISGYLAQERSVRSIAPILWAASAVGAPLTILVALYLRIAGFERSLPFAATALALAAVFAFATDRLAKRQPRPGLAASIAIFASGAVAGLALALTLALEKGWLSVAFALMVPGIAWVAQKRGLPALRWLAVGLTLIVAGRIVWEPQIVGGDLGSTPIFNWLLWGYGVPAASFWFAGILLRKRSDDIPARTADSAAILFTVLLVFFEIRHFMTGGEIFSDRTGLGEIALQVSMVLAMSIGLEGVRARTGNIVHNLGAMCTAGLAFAGIVIGLLLIENPLINPVDVGGPFINLVLLGYALPAILAAILALTTRQTRRRWYRGASAVTAVTLAIVYLTLEVRRLYQGPVLAYGAISNAEQYTYSTVWLGFGILLLFGGIVLRSQPLRIASAAVVLATVGKVFLIDMGELTGGFRALSFIGLGLVLVAIGWLYQRLLFPPKTLQPAEG